MMVYYVFSNIIFVRGNYGGDPVSTGIVKPLRQAEVVGRPL